jgi:hypothetical protein
VDPGREIAASGKATPVWAAKKFLLAAAGDSEAIASARISVQHGVPSCELCDASSACPASWVVAEKATGGAPMWRMYAAQTGCRSRKNSAKNATAAYRSFDVLLIGNALFTAFIAPFAEYAPASPNALDLGQNPS